MTDTPMGSDAKMTELIRRAVVMAKRDLSPFSFNEAAAGVSVLSQDREAT